MRQVVLHVLSSGQWKGNSCLSIGVRVKFTRLTRINDAAAGPYCVWQKKAQAAATYGCCGNVSATTTTLVLTRPNVVERCLSRTGGELLWPTQELPPRQGGAITPASPCTTREVQPPPPPPPAPSSPFYLPVERQPSQTFKCSPQRPLHPSRTWN